MYTVLRIPPCLLVINYLSTKKVQNSQIGVGNSLSSICVYLSPEEKRSATRRVARALHATRARTRAHTPPKSFTYLFNVCEKAPLETN